MFVLRNDFLSDLTQTFFWIVRHILEPLVHPSLALVLLHQRKYQLLLLAQYLNFFYIHMHIYHLLNYLVEQSKYTQIYMVLIFVLEMGEILFILPSSITIISPLLTSLINFAPTISRAQVSEAKI